MAKRRTRLSKLRVNEVSLVDRPANPASRFVLAKRDENEDEPVEKKMCSYCNDHEAMSGGTMCASCSMMGKAADYNALLDVSVETILKDDSLTDEQRTSLLDTTISQYRASISKLTKLPLPDASTAGVTKQDKPMADEKNTEVLKGLSDEQKAVVEKLLADSTKGLLEEVEKANKRSNEVIATLAKRDRIAKCESIVKDTPLKAEDMAKVFEAVSDNAEVVAYVTDLAKKYSVALEAGQVLKELGADFGMDVSDPLTQIDTAVAKKMSGDSKLTKEQAYAKVLIENPDLYAATLNTR